MLLLQGLMRRFCCLRAAFSLRFYLYSFRNFFSYISSPPPPPSQYWRSYQINAMIWIFLSTSVLGANMLDWALRKRPIINQMFLPPWPLAVLSRIRVIRANAAIHLKWLPTGLIVSEIKTLKTEGTIKHKETLEVLEMHSQYTPQGHPTAIFGKISDRKTIWDLEFSEHLL